MPRKFKCSKCGKKEEKGMLLSIGLRYKYKGETKGRTRTIRLCVECIEKLSAKKTAVQAAAV